MKDLQEYVLRKRVRRAVEEIEDVQNPRAICMICRRLGVSWKRIEAHARKFMTNNGESDNHG
jgi:ribosomal protein L37AE/L43A